MHQPIAVFDAGIGSYAIVAAIQKRLPRQDIIYFADRASFPYGGKDREQLLSIMRQSISFLENFDPSAIIIASNAPSIMVLDEVRKYCALPLYGVFPPLQQALAASRSGHVGIMAVRSLVDSENLPRFIEKHTNKPDNVALIDASPMVDLVENGSFLFSPADTQAAVGHFADEIFQRYPLIDALTLSSTHLPWLQSFLKRPAPIVSSSILQRTLLRASGLEQPALASCRGLSPKMKTMIWTPFGACSNISASIFRLIWSAPEFRALLRPAAAHQILPPHTTTQIRLCFLGNRSSRSAANARAPLGSA